MTDREPPMTDAELAMFTDWKVGMRAPTRADMLRLVAELRATRTEQDALRAEVERLRNLICPDGHWFSLGVCVRCGAARD